VLPEGERRKISLWGGKEGAFPGNKRKDPGGGKGAEIVRIKGGKRGGGLRVGKKKVGGFHRQSSGLLDTTGWSRDRKKGPKCRGPFEKGRKKNRT